MKKTLHWFQYSDLGLHNYDRYCKMSSEELLQLPLNFYITILGIGLFILILTFIFCCYMFRYNSTEVDGLRGQDSDLQPTVFLNGKYGFSIFCMNCIECILHILAETLD